MAHSSSCVWIVVGIMTIGTFALRLSFIGWLSGGAVPDRLRRTLRFIPPAVLAALILPALLGVGGEASWVERGFPVIAALIAVVVAWRTRNMLLPIGAGMIALWTLRALVAP